MHGVRRVAVVGLGLMGGSLARALAARDVTVLGYDRDTDSLDDAVREGIVAERLDATLRDIGGCDLIVLATPVQATCDLLLPIARAGGDAWVMDLASTKGSVVHAAEAVGLGERFIGAHPLTGSHRSGWGAARANLFDDARVFLCPTASTSPETLARAVAFWRTLRAGTEILDAALHDVQMAWRSHLPHFVSTALALTLRDAGITRSALGPGGRDMTRLAGSDPALWTGIATDNADALAEALAAMEDRLRWCREGLRRAQDASSESVELLLSRGRAWFDGDPLEGQEDRKTGRQEDRS